MLAGFGERLSDKAARELRRVGVELRVNTKIVGVDETGVDVVAADGTRSRVEAMSKVWAAGVAASPLGAQLAGQCGTQVDHAGRIKVEPDCSLPGHPEVFVVGDMMSLQNLGRSPRGVDTLRAGSCRSGDQGVLGGDEGLPA